MRFSGLLTLTDRRQKGVLQPAIPDHICPAAARFEILCETDARLLNPAFPAGDRDHVGLEIRVRLKKGLFDHGGRQAHRVAQLAQDLGAPDGRIGRARLGEIFLRRQARAAAVFLPLMPGSARRAHDIGHGAGFTA